jgi:transposase
MMGRQKVDQSSLFYEFRLADRIPKDHLLRRINVFATAVLADVHNQLKRYYSEIGRPSVDPELMIRLLIVGYCHGLRSEAGSLRLCSAHVPRAPCEGSTAFRKKSDGPGEFSTDH